MNVIDFYRSRAILVGTGHYTSGLAEMPAARNSLRAMHDLLTGPLCGWPGSRVSVFEDKTTRDGVDQQIAKLIHETTDVLLFYYVGHGQLLDGEHLGMALSDTYSDPDMRHTTSLRLHELRTELKYRCKARVKIVILDCCFSGLATRNTQGLGLADQVALATKVEGAYTLAAARHWQKARHEDGPDGLTYFTRFFTETVGSGIPSKGAMLTLKEIQDEVAERCLNLDLPDWETRPEPSTLVVDTAEQLPFARNAASLADAGGPQVPAAPSRGSVPWLTRIRVAISGLRVRGRSRNFALAGAVATVVVLVAVVGWGPWSSPGSYSPLPQGSDQGSAPSVVAKQVRALNGHTNLVTKLMFSPDGRTLATVGGDQTLRLWDVASGKQIGEPFTGYTTDAAYSPDGRTVAIAGLESPARLWDVTTHEQVGEPFGKAPNFAMSVAFSSDGRILATAGFPGAVQLWDVATHQPIGAPLLGNGQLIGALRFSPDNRILAVTSGDRSVRLWDVTSQQPLGDPLPGSGDPYTNVAFSPDSRTVAIGGSDAVGVWDVATRQQVDRPLSGYTGSVKHVAFSPDGRTVAVVGGDVMVRLWGMASHKQLGQPFGRAMATSGMAFSPDGRMLAIADLDNSVGLWEITGLR